MTKNPVLRGCLSALVAAATLGIATPTALAGTLDVPLRLLLQRTELTGRAPTNVPGGLVNVHRKSHGAPDDLVDVLIEADPAAIPALTKLGAEVRTVVSGGILTATVPVRMLRAVARANGVVRVEAAKRKRPYMDVSRGATGLDVPGSYPEGAPTGAGVVVGVLDTGIDWTHPDFITSTGFSRVYAVWDQADYADAGPPAGFSYGTEYDAASVQACVDGSGAYCYQTDVDGHGTHVAGTAAGNGLAYGAGSSQYQYAGVAPEATLVIVRFDFDGSRNSDAAVVDGVDWIFRKAAELGMPAVVNMSLGSDLGPHDGTTLEERGLTNLTGAGRLVVVAAGNPGNTGDDTWGNLSLWGYPMHGAGTVPAGGYSTIQVDVPAFAAGTENYVFFDIWYSGADKNRVQIVTPSGKAYPPNFKGSNRSVWRTGSRFTGYDTAEGGLLVGNGGDQFGWDTTNGDNELYVEIGDAYGTVPTAGTWQIRIWDDGITNGTYNGWHGESASMILARPYYDGQPTDNRMTVGTPATAQGAIAIAAYATRMGWEYLDMNASDGLCAAGTPCCQTYNDYDPGNLQSGGPLSYYDPYFVDANGNGVFDHDFGGDCTYEEGVDSAEPFNGLAFFSARGPSRDGRVKPEVAAPGVGIVASFSQTVLQHEATLPPSQTYFARTNRILADGWHAVLQGTSMACPHGTGAAALLLQADPTLDPAGARAVLQDTARQDSYTGTLPNDDWGYGKIDVTAALLSLSCQSDADCDDGDPCTQDSCAASLCWHDPAAEGAGCGGGAICCGGACGQPACAADMDCDDSDACTTDQCTGAGTCAATCAVTPIPDCGPTEICGDGVCAGAAAGEDCFSCAQDCGCKGKGCSKACCGDGVCGSENAATCPIDCQ